MSVVTIYVTASTLDEAKNIARTIVGERLVACANILGTCDFRIPLGRCRSGGDRGRHDPENPARPRWGCN